MKTETFLYSLSEVGEDLLAASEQPIQTRTRRFGRIASLAASLAVIAGLSWLAVRVIAQRSEAPAQSTGKPVAELAADAPDPSSYQGEGGLMLDYESDRLIVFHDDQIGLYCYDLQTQAMRFSVNLQKAVGAESEVETLITKVTVSGDGNTVQIARYDRAADAFTTACEIDVASQTYTAGAYVPLAQPAERTKFRGRIEGTCYNLSAVCYRLEDRLWPLFPDTAPQIVSPLSDLAIGAMDGGTPIGSAVQLIYEDESRIMFYMEMGMFCYDLDEKETVFTVDFQKALGMAGALQGTSPGSVAEVSEDGSTVVLSIWRDMAEFRGSAIYIDVPSLTYTYQNYEGLPQLFDRARIEGSLDWEPPAVLRNLRYTRGEAEWRPFDQAADLPTLAARQSFGGEDILLSADDVRERLESNLWTAELAETDPAFQTMPVFEDPHGTESIGGITSRERMMELCERVFHALGWEDFRVVINPTADGGPEVIETLTQHTDELTVEVTNHGRITVTFTESLPFPDEGSFDPDDPRQVQQCYCKYLMQMLEIPWAEDWELNMLSIAPAGNPRYTSGRSTSEHKEQFLANELTGLTLTLNDEQALVSFSFDAFDAYGYRWLPLGDYPIITAAEAAVHVRQNEYFQITVYGGDNRWTWLDDDLSRVELIYPNEGAYRLRMPYYRFWRLASSPDYNGGEPVYVPLYVPAIERAYLEDFPATVYVTTPTND